LIEKEKGWEKQDCGQSIQRIREKILAKGAKIRKIRGSGTGEKAHHRQEHCQHGVRTKRRGESS